MRGGKRAKKVEREEDREDVDCQRDHEGLCPYAVEGVEKEKRGELGKQSECRKIVSCDSSACLSRKQIAGKTYHLGDPTSQLPAV